MTQQELISERMEQLGITWYVLARDTGINKGTLSSFKNGKYTLKKPDIVNALAKVLILEPDTIYMAGNHLPPDITTGIIRNQELIPVIRNLITKLDTNKGRRT